MPTPIVRVTAVRGAYEIRLLRYDPEIVAALKTTIPARLRSYDPATKLWSCSRRELIVAALSAWPGQVEWIDTPPPTPAAGFGTPPPPRNPFMEAAGLRDHRDQELTRLRAQMERDTRTIAGLRAELAAAKAQSAARPSAPSSPEAAFRVILRASSDPRAAFRSLSRAVHPDTGGDAALMVALNAARDSSTAAPHRRTA